MKRLLITLLMLPTLALAQAYPTKPIRMIIPFAPGGASDFVGRIMQPKMHELLGQPIVVENRAGAAGNIGAEAAAKSAPDGYTMLLGNVGSIAINPGVYPKLSINPVKDFIAVNQVVDVPSILIIHPSVPANNVRELVMYAKANQGKLNFASPGSGSLDRLEMELFRKLERLDIVHVPYKGGAGPATAGLMGGETQLMFATAASAMPGVKSGRLKPLAVTSTKRIDTLPDVPTVAEAGYPDLKAGSWQGIFLPAGTPREVVDRLFNVTTQVMKDADVIARLKNGGAEALTSPSPAEFAKFVAVETERWAKIAKEAGATPD
ncbi:MAG: tripartite tricarboxylate transporter substrate binding protein [Betaproteobacteria bacterium]|nr:MAG: tripartite tricarboxylate transporter substrate binding protein [Betaproteobacteria bacterium]